MPWLASVIGAVALLGATEAAPEGDVAKATVVFATPPPALGALGLISRTEATGPFAYTYRRVADNFEVAADAAVSGVVFWGGMETIDGSLGNVQLVRVEFFEESGVPGVGPGSSIAAFDIPAAQTSPALADPPQSVGLLLAPMYRFEIALPQVVELEAGRSYWLSIAGQLSTAPDPLHEAWAWSSGVNTTGDTLIAQDRFDGQGWMVRTLTVRNAAFELLGTAVPPPSCPGDANGDLMVNAADLSVLLSNFGQPAAGALFGDFNGDGQCDAADLSVLLSQFGAACT